MRLARPSYQKMEGGQREPSTDPSSIDPVDTTLISDGHVDALNNLIHLLTLAKDAIISRKVSRGLKDVTINPRTALGLDVYKLILEPLGQLHQVVNSVFDNNKEWIEAVVAWEYNNIQNEITSPSKGALSQPGINKKNDEVLNVIVLCINVIYYNSL